METTPNRQPAEPAATVHVIDAEADLVKPDWTPEPTGFRRPGVLAADPPPAPRTAPAAKWYPGRGG